MKRETYFYLWLFDGTNGCGAHRHIIIMFVYVHLRVCVYYLCVHFVKVCVCLAPNILTFYTAGLKYII